MTSGDSIVITGTPAPVGGNIPHVVVIRAAEDRPSGGASGPQTSPYFFARFRSELVEEGGVR